MLLSFSVIHFSSFLLCGTRAFVRKIKICTYHPVRLDIQQWCNQRWTFSHLPSHCVALDAINIKQVQLHSSPRCTSNSSHRRTLFSVVVLINKFLPPFLKFVHLSRDWGILRFFFFENDLFYIFMKINQMWRSFLLELTVKKEDFH